MKTEVYSWRLSSNLKIILEETARREQMSVSALLTQIVNSWINRKKLENADDEKEQNRIREEAMNYAGSIQGGNPHLAEQASQRVKDQLSKQYHARKRTD